MYCKIINNTFPLQVPAYILNHVSVCVSVSVVDQVESEVVRQFGFLKFTLFLFALLFSFCLFFYERQICQVITHELMSKPFCSVHQACVCFQPCSSNHPFQSEINTTTTTTKHYTTQAKKITFCFIGSEAEAYDVISDAEGTLLFLHWVECLNVITCR